MKIWAAMHDGKAVYVLLGSENQSREHDGKFHTGFGTLMQVIKHQNQIEVYDIIRDAPDVDTVSAGMINEIANVEMEIVPDENGRMNMCKGIEAHELKRDVVNAISLLRDMGLSDEEITERVAKKYEVTVNFVKGLMMPKAI